ncbi:hypothetical protein GOP47_0013919 [Adiantum capillus-veneris]|uniref:Uncharacterized protein n=1 Tax=Adiantum capillus-veneris TaxID=13818 RepID=A0A9D4UPF6_ADICA|nr:hypothetical protein GOP47_0013919 [Adiantum capillus-veneris]
MHRIRSINFLAMVNIGLHTFSSLCHYLNNFSIIKVWRIFSPFKSVKQPSNITRSTKRHCVTENSMACFLESQSRATHSTRIAGGKTTSKKPGAPGLHRLARG